MKKIIKLIKAWYYEKKMADCQLELVMAEGELERMYWVDMWWHYEDLWLSL